MIYIADEKYTRLVEPRLKDIANWAAAGASQKEIAARLGISLSSLKNYKKDNEDLDNAISYSKTYQITDIAATVAALATGYDYVEQEIVKLKNEDGSERAEVRKVVKHAPPNLNAAKYFLENRSPKWTENKRQYELKKAELELKRREVNENPSGVLKVQVVDDV